MPLSELELLEPPDEDDDDEEDEELPVDEDDEELLDELVLEELELEELELEELDPVDEDELLDDDDTELELLELDDDGVGVVGPSSHAVERPTAVTAAGTPINKSRNSRRAWRSGSDSVGIGGEAGSLKVIVAPW